MVAHFVAVLLTGFIIYTAVPGSSLFSWHPTLMAVAYLLFMFEGLLVFSPISSLVSHWSRASKVNLHGLLQFTSLSCALGGFAVIYYNKELNNLEHFTSWHGLIGLSAVSYTCMQIVAGTVLKYSSRLKLHMSLKYSELKVVHAISGLVLCILFCSAFILAMFTSWFTQNVTGTTWYACLGCISCLLFIIINQVGSKYIVPLISKRRHTE